MKNNSVFISLAEDTCANVKKTLTRSCPIIWYHEWDVNLHKRQLDHCFFSQWTHFSLTSTIRQPQPWLCAPHTVHQQCTTHCAPAARAHFSWALRHYAPCTEINRFTSHARNVKVLLPFTADQCQSPRIFPKNLWQYFSKKNYFGIDKHADFNHKYNFVNVNKLLTFLRRFFGEPIFWISPTHNFFFTKKMKKKLPPFEFLQKL